MADLSRRGFLRGGIAGLAAGTMGTLVLRAGAQPTESSGTLGSYAELAKDLPAPAGGAAGEAGKWAVTEDNILGPFHRKGAPFRAKITPPLEPGRTLLITGRVWGFDTRKPLPSAVLDVWQANHDGRYDNDDPRNPPAEGVFKNRARLITDESGRYEYETIYPGKYLLAKDTFRPAHIHYLVRARGYKDLVTQLYFEGDPDNAKDPFIKKSLIIKLTEEKVRDGVFVRGTFDIVLAPAQ